MLDVVEGVGLERDGTRGGRGGGRRVRREIVEASEIGDEGEEGWLGGGLCELRDSGSLEAASSRCVRFFSLSLASSVPPLASPLSPTSSSLAFP